MASAAIAGRKAYIRSSTAAASTATTSQTLWVEMRDYTLTFERTDIEVTNHDSSGFYEAISGIGKWNWEANILHISTGAGHGALRQHVLGTNPALVNITFQQTTAAASKKFQGKTRITGFTVGPHGTNDAVMGTMKGVGSGALARTA